VKEDIVYNAATDEMVGFVNLGDNHPAENCLATHVLQFYIRSVATNFSRPFAFYSTHNIAAYQLAELFWEVVDALTSCDFFVLGLVADGAANNRKMFSLLNNSDSNEKITHKIVNIYNPNIPIFILPDPSHLLKTTCNCVRSSRPNGSRLLKYGNHFILWEHFCRVPKLFKSDELRCCKLTAEHFNLSSYAKMRVRPAAQLLSRTVSQIMKARGGDEMTRSAWLAGLINRWWDLMNTRIHYGYNLDLKPYQSSDDPRLQWLMDTFLREIIEWKNSCNDDSGKRIDKMFISKETFTGLIVSTHAMVSLVKYVLQHSPEGTYVQTRRINQDALEAYFGHMRKVGGRNEHPNVNQYSQFENHIVTSKQIKCIKGSNVRGVDWKFGKVSDEPLPKRIRLR